jgi:hypothetical protein
MDVYTCSFTYPRRSRHLHSLVDFPRSDVRGPTSADSFPNSHPNGLPDISAAQDADAVQKLAMMAMTLHGCHVSYFLEQGRSWNFQITGAYQQVMVARGMILKECPIQVTTSSYFSALTATDAFLASSERPSCSFGDS